MGRWIVPFCPANIRPFCLNVHLAHISSDVLEDSWCVTLRLMSPHFYVEEGQEGSRLLWDSWRSSPFELKSYFSSMLGMLLLLMEGFEPRCENISVMSAFEKFLMFITMREESTADFHDSKSCERY